VSHILAEPCRSRDHHLGTTPVRVSGRSTLFPLCYAVGRRDFRPRLVHGKLCLLASLAFHRDTDEQGARLQRTRSAPLEAGLIDYDSIARDSRAVIDAWPGCRSPFQPKIEVALVPVSREQYNMVRRARAPIPLSGAARKTAHVASLGASSPSQDQPSSSSFSPVSIRKLAPPGRAPSSTSVDSQRSGTPEAGAEQDSTFIHQRQLHVPQEGPGGGKGSGQGRSGSVETLEAPWSRGKWEEGGEGRRAGEGVVQDFTAKLSSTAVSSFIDKHMLSIRRVDSACRPSASEKS